MTHRHDRIIDAINPAKTLQRISMLLILLLFSYGIRANTDLSLTPAEQLWLDQHPEIRLAIDIDWAPFEFVDDSGRYRGMAAEYIALVEKRLGIKFQVDTKRTWSEMVEAVKNRQLDLFSCVVKTPQREQFATFTKPYITFPMVIVTRDSEHFVDGLKDLRGKKVAVVNSYATHDLLAENSPELELFLSDNVQHGLEAVSNGQAYAFVGNLAAIGQVIKESGLSNLKVSGQTPWRFELGMAVRNDWPELASILQKALDSITREERALIYNHWFKVEFDQQTNYRLLALVIGSSLILMLVFIFWNKQLQGEVRRRLRVEGKLKDSRNFQATILNSANYSIISTNIEGQIRSFNGGAERMLGYQEKDLLGKSLVDLIHSKEDVARKAKRLTEELGYPIQPGFQTLTAKARRQLPDEGEWIYQCKNGQSLPVQLSNTCVINHDAQISGFLFVGIDISQRKGTEKRLQLAQKVIENTSEGIIITDPGGTIVDVNPAHLETMGYRRDEVIGNNPRMWKSGRHDHLFYKKMWARLLKDGFWEGEIWDRRKNGEVFPKWLSINAIKDEQDNVLNYVALSTDISQQKATEQELENLAFYDPLTNLPNRTLFRDRLEHELLIAKRFNRPLGLMFLDLDRFKDVNDTFGHEVGDLLLEKVARRLEGCLRASDTVCRLGGDEFTVILTEISSPDALAHIADNMITAINQAFVLNNQQVFISTSIGIALFPDDGMDFSTLTRNADIAMYKCKEAGRDNYSFYTADMNVQNQARISMESDLRKALEKDQLELHYQPIVDLTDGKVVAMEALVRWKHPLKGMIMPQQFISLAEETGLIIPLGEWVLHTACRDTQKLNRDGWPELKVSVNLSGRQFQSDELVNRVVKTLNETQLAAKNLQLEVTESMIMRDVDEAVEIMRQLNTHGLKISIDDFGTGYSSLSHLKKFPLHSLKIDRSFIRDIADDKDDAAIVETIISMAKAMDLNVTAEGVETLCQLEFLQQRHCNLVQGYYFSKPIPLSDLYQFLNKTPQSVSA